MNVLGLCATSFSSMRFFFYAVLSLLIIWGLAMSASSVAFRSGLIMSIPAVIGAYVLAGAAFTTLTIGVKAFLMPNVPPGTIIKRFSPQFAAWWLVNRFVDLNNLLFMRNFRGTVLLNYYYAFLVRSVLAYLLNNRAYNRIMSSSFVCTSCRVYLLGLVKIGSSNLGQEIQGLTF